MLHLLSFHNTPHSVPASQIDSFQNITIKVHYEINLAEVYPCNMFIYM